MIIKMKRTTPAYRQPQSTTTIMRDLLIVEVTLAIASILMQVYRHNINYGLKAFGMYIMAILTALITEGVWAWIHQKPMKGIITDSFCLNTPIIFTLTLPIGTPYYVVVIGAFIATFFGKLVYGGFGQNIFNPALVGRVVVHLSFASKLTNSLSVIDASTSPTPATALAKTNWFGTSAFPYSLKDLLLGMHDGALGEGLIILLVIIGVILALRHVYDPRITLSYLGSVALFALVSGLVLGINPFVNCARHLMLGGLMIGAILMATDPVTSPSSPLGKIIYGISLGFLTLLIRLKANYPEGVLFSILIMNMLTPWIDSLILGRTSKHHSKQIAIILIMLCIGMGTIGGISTTLQPQKQSEVGEFYEAHC